MRKTIAVVSATGALLFGGAGVANAEFTHAGVPASTTTTLAQDDYGTNNDDNSGLWGLAGLLGLLGLLGLRQRYDNRAGIGSGSGRTHTGPTSGSDTSGTSLGTSGTSTVAPTTRQSHPGGTPPTV